MRLPHHLTSHLLPHNNENEDDVPNSRDKNDAEHVVAKTLIGTGQYYPKDNHTMYEEKIESDEGSKAE